MRFQIVNEKNNEQKSQKDSQKDPQTRQSSATKYNRQNSFLQMVKNSYEFYMTIGKDELKKEQLKIAAQKEEKCKKIIKKQTVAQQRQIKKVKELRRASKTSENIVNENHAQENKLKQSINPPRRSQRSKNLISYAQPNLALDDKQIFDVLDIGEQNQQNQEQQISKESGSMKSLEKLSSKNLTIIEKIQKMKEQLIFEEEGTYEVGLAHEFILRAQKFIDEHINFRHEIRQSKFVELGALIKYLKSHGFLSFDEKKFHLLTRINPYLYNFSESDDKYLMTFKLNGLEIEKRLDSTRRRMSQVSIPELFT